MPLLIHRQPSKLENGTPFQANAAPVLEWASFQHPLTQGEAPCTGHNLHSHNGYLDWTC